MDKVEHIKGIIKKYFKPTQKELANQLALEFQGENHIHYEPGAFLYVPGKSKVCYVAHLDTVHKKRIKNVYISVINNEHHISSPQGIGADDRAGVYAACKIYQEATIKPSLLFTFDEEIGGVGIKKFVKTDLFKSLVNKTNIFIEFDRMGKNDYVTYNHENDDVSSILEKNGFINKHGTYSDVSTISQHGGVLGVNISTGYYNAHRLEEYFVLEQLENNIQSIMSIEKQLSSEKREAKENTYSMYYRNFSYTPQKFHNPNFIDEETAQISFFDYGLENGLSLEMASIFEDQVQEIEEISGEHPTTFIKDLLDDFLDAQNEMMTEAEYE